MAADDAGAAPTEISRSVRAAVLACPVARGLVASEGQRAWATSWQRYPRATVQYRGSSWNGTVLARDRATVFYSRTRAFASPQTTPRPCTSLGALHRSRSCTHRQFLD